MEISIAQGRKHGSASALNDLAWILLTHEYEQLRDPPRSLELADRACKEARDNGSERLWMYLDTLALAQHENGDSTSAFKTQQEAVKRMPVEFPNGEQEEMTQRLHKYEASLDLERQETEAALHCPHQKLATIVQAGDLRQPALKSAPAISQTSTENENLKRLMRVITSSAHQR